MNKASWAGLLILLVLGAGRTLAAGYPAPVEGDYLARDFRFSRGEVLPELRLHYRTLGAAARDGEGRVMNAVLILHGTGGDGGNFFRQRDGSDPFAGELFGPGQLLDAARYFIILPDAIGHGRSSRPSDGLRGGFPRYGYQDMVRAQHQLLTEGLGVNHLRLIIGTSMGGMHTWLWGAAYPQFMDALLPLASLPTQISGRNRIWRRIVMDAIRNDPGWQGGFYDVQPGGLRTATQMLLYVSGNSLMRQAAAPTLQAADRFLDSATQGMQAGTDANDLLWAVAASEDYDPGPGLPQIQAPLLAINFADDLINPPELGILEREIRRVPHGTAIIIPAGAGTAGHGTHTRAVIWKQHLEKLLRQIQR